MKPLADHFVTVFESPDSKELFCYSPGLCQTPSGRMVGTFDIGGPGVKDLPGLKSTVGDFHGGNIGKCVVSDDGGRTWEHRLDFPFYHARPFMAGNRLYILGHSGDLMIVASDDHGQTWSQPTKLTHNHHWHQAPCNVHYANGCVYLVMERQVYDDCKAWKPSVHAPVLMRAKINADLTKRESWSFATERVFRDEFDNDHLIGQGRFFYPIDPLDFYLPDPSQPGRNSAPPGWLESNVVQIVDPQHYWFDPTGKTLHLVMRLHLANTGYAALLKVTEQGDAPGTGEMITSFEHYPSGGECRIIALPGGQMKFHILYDPTTRLYWLLSSQATDSMTKAEHMPADRINLPNNERHRLVLHFSKNLIDWCFAGVVAIGKTALDARHYASMIVVDQDLCILSRSANQQAKNAHDGNLITFHRVQNFRELVY